MDDVARHGVLKQWAEQVKARARAVGRFLGRSDEGPDGSKHVFRLARRVARPLRFLIGETDRAAEPDWAPHPRQVFVRVLRRFLLFVGGPCFLAAFYYGLWASDVYIAEARFAVRTNAAPAGRSVLDSVLGSSGISGAGEDASIVQDYIMSHDMLRELARRLELRAHYSSRDVDIFTRMDDEATEEEFLEFFRKMVVIRVESSTDIATLRARGFTPVVAQRIATAVLELSEDLVNTMSERISEDTLRFARSEVAIAEDRVRLASDAVTQFRSESRSIDPSEETSAVLGIVTKLESELADAKAELIGASSMMRSDSPKVRNLRNRVVALETQVDRERERLANESGPDLTALIDGYDPLVLEKELAKQQYTSALTSLELARAEAQRKQRYLIAFVKPQLPDEALEPERAWMVFSVFVAMSVLFTIGGLLWSAIKDHAGL